MCPKESKKLAQWLPRGAQLCVHFVLRGSLLAHTSIKIKKRRQLENNTICYVRSLQIWPRIGLYSDWPTLHLKKLQRPGPKGTIITIKSRFIVITNLTHLNWRFEPETIKQTRGLWRLEPETLRKQQEQRRFEPETTHIINLSYLHLV